MYKKIFSAILFGALTIASTSTFVSCKDYDDDINDLNERLVANDADNQALHDALEALKTEAGNLKTQLEQKEGELKVLIASAQTAADEAKTAIDAEIVRAKAAEAALQTKIEACERTEAELRTLIEGLEANKVSKTEYEAKVKEIYTSLESIESQLGAQLKRIETLEKGLSDEATARAAAVKDLQEQIETLDKFAKALAGTESTDKQDLLDAVAKLREDLTKAIADIQSAADDVEALQKRMQAAEERVSDIEPQLTTINVMILRALRSIVFVPDFYYWGIEATGLTGSYIRYWKITDMPEVNADKADPTWDNGSDVLCYDYKGHSNKQRANDFMVETFIARYHLNPSTADLSKATINILQGDRKYFTKAFPVAKDAKNTNIKVASFDYEKDITNGDLNLKLDITDPSLIKNMGHFEDGRTGEERHYVQDADETEYVTVFAAEVELNDDNQNTVTSDYAALRAEINPNGYRLAHTINGDPAIKDYMPGVTGSYTRVVNTTNAPDGRTPHVCDDKGWLVCNPCDLGTVKNRHLFTDADETVYGLDDQIKTLTDQPLVQALNATSYSTTTAQDVVYYDGTINLSKLAEVHRLGTTESTMTAAQLEANGFEIRFELTGLFMAGNKTSESAHAAIKKDENGDYILRPQLPKMAYQEDGQNIGTQDAWGADQSRTTIGRTPLVRVLLVDTKNNDRVLDYGYIRLVIIEKPVVIQRDVLTVVYKTGASPKITYYNYACTQPAVGSRSWEQKWGSFEHDLYNLVSLSQVDFDNRYEVIEAENFVYANGTAIDASKAVYGSIITGALAQYLVKENANGTYEFTEAPEKDYIGIISKKPGTDVGDGTLTDVIRWVITGQEFRKLALEQNLNKSATRVNRDYNNEGYLAAQKSVEYTRAIKFQVIDNADRTRLKDIFVILKAEPVVAEPNNDKSTITGKFDTNKIVEYWYDENTQKTKNTLKEAHLNVPSPEDWIETWRDGAAKPFEFLLSSDFDKNEILASPINSAATLAKFFDIDDKTPLKDFAYSHLKNVRIQFDPENTGKQFKGFSGKTYTLSIGKRGNEENWALLATLNNRTDTVAYLEYDKAGLTSYNNVKIVLKKKPSLTGGDHLNSYAEDLLNYKRHDELDDNLLKVLLGFQVSFDCTDFNVGTIQVRFLRPVNVLSENKEVQDAANTSQIIPLYDIIRLTDWRDQWNPTADSEVNKPRTLFPTPWVKNDATGKYTVDYWYYYNIKEIHVGYSPVVDVDDDGRSLNSIMHTNLNGNNIKTTLLSSVSNNVEFTYLEPTKLEEEVDEDGNVTGTHASAIGEPNYYGRIQYTNNRSTVDEFDVTVPVTVCYEWGHLYEEVTIHIVKTLHNTDVKVRR